MGLYEILKASKLGAGAAPDMYTALFAQKISGGEAELSGVPPLTFRSNGTPLLDYLISGNTTQSGTPTPTTPIMPQGTGERTGNLFSCNLEQGTITMQGEYRDSDNRVRSDDFIIVEAGEYTINALSEIDTLRVFLFEYMEDGTFVTRTPPDWANVPYTFTLTGKRKIKFVFSFALTENISPAMVNSVMLNTGSTALPYEPFGVKIPISSNSTTTPVYLGEVQTTRRVKKLVLDGTESVEIVGGGDNYSYFRLQIGNLGYAVSDTVLSTHFRQATITTQTTTIGCNIINSTSTQKCFVAFRPDSVATTSLTQFKQWLAAQYAAGTPVTVWYVLAESETAVVNEPLMKIGDYADTLSKAQVGVSIPTNNGSTTVDVDTTVKPSEVYIKYHT